MRGRLSQNDVTNSINVEDHNAVKVAVRTILQNRYPDASFQVIDQVFDDVFRLYNGDMPGYLPCDTPYHDLRHTLDMTLAMARLVDGHDRVHEYFDQLGSERAILGIIAALLHDAGYIREQSDDAHRHGAEYTSIHVSRSAAFLGKYLLQLGLSNKVPLAFKIVHFTGYEIGIENIHLENPLDRKLGYMLGSADLIAQMSDRLYLEKCRDYLYSEFVYGGLAIQRLQDGTEQVNYASPEDLLAKTPQFHDDVALKRLNKNFHAVHNYAEAHFDGENLYIEEIKRNLSYLSNVLQTRDFSKLRRNSVSLSLTSRH